MKMVTHYHESYTIDSNDISFVRRGGHKRIKMRVSKIRYSEHYLPHWDTTVCSYFISGLNLNDRGTKSINIKYVPTDIKLYLHQYAQRAGVSPHILAQFN